MSIQRTLVADFKCGCGKTTIATNIASHYAQSGLNDRLFGHDSQGQSALDNLNLIHGVDTVQKKIIGTPVPGSY